MDVYALPVEKSMSRILILDNNSHLKITFTMFILLGCGLNIYIYLQNAS